MEVVTLGIGVGIEAWKKVLLGLRTKNVWNSNFLSLMTDKAHPNSISIRF